MQQTHAGEIQKYADIVKGYENQIQDFGKQMGGLEKQLANVQQEVQKEICAPKKEATLQALQQAIRKGTVAVPYLPVI
jgi:hypothetical protein